jgi:hypothetical protein
MKYAWSICKVFASPIISACSTSGGPLRDAINRGSPFRDLTWILHRPSFPTPQKADLSFETPVDLDILNSSCARLLKTPARKDSYLDGIRR